MTSHNTDNTRKTGTEKSDTTTRSDTDKRTEPEGNEDLIYGGICPVCGEEFVDGFSEMEENTSYDGRICVDEINGDGEGKMLVHLSENAEGPEQNE